MDERQAETGGALFHDFGDVCLDVAPEAGPVGQCAAEGAEVVEVGMLCREGLEFGLVVNLGFVICLPLLRSGPFSGKSHCAKARMGAMPVPVAMRMESVTGWLRMKWPWGPWILTAPPGSRSVRSARWLEKNPPSTRLTQRSKRLALAADAIE